jgi:hypothetical protein
MGGEDQCFHPHYVFEGQFHHKWRMICRRHRPHSAVSLQNIKSNNRDGTNVNISTSGFAHALALWSLNQSILRNSHE